VGSQEKFSRLSQLQAHLRVSNKHAGSLDSIMSLS
jgi:hypothetical protein